ncbi:MAG: haloacid dehalogenase-like hydrolase [Candidatus Aenigmarchaeota archaeon]|nr:haloacid dehalogenase-like hydrolase [Candidatus Aenigmarchaeota archaeon]
MAFGVYYDVDGCALIGHDNRMVYRSTFYCRHNPINVAQTRDNLIAHGLLSRELFRVYESEFGDVNDPAALIRVGEFGRFDSKPKELGMAINKEALAEIERRANENLPLDAFYQALHEAALTPGLGDFAAWTRSHGGRPLIVTDGWDLVAEYLAGKIGAERYAGSHPVFEGGRFTGEVRKLEQKKPVIDDLMKLMKIPYENSIGIDDASSVVTQFGLPIAFCPTNPKLREHPGIVVVEEPHYKHVQKAAEEWLSKR